MITVDRIPVVRARCDEARAAGARVGLVPTMGAFHAGHRSLMRAARAADDLVVVSLFVNPLQFGAGEDLAGYPRDRAGDAAVAAEEGVDVLFAPPVDEMYPQPSRTTVHVADITEGLCGASRPGHFDGVSTVVTKLLAAVGPCRAYFGRKDAQQLAVVQRMVADLNLPAEIVGCPLVREPDGLAMSSRNAYLSATERRAATVLWRALRDATAAVRDGERDADALCRRVAGVVAAEPLVRLEYVAAVDADELAPVAALEGDVLLALAARVGRARLIDNARIGVRGSTVDVDLGVGAPL